MAYGHVTLYCLHIMQCTKYTWKATCLFCVWSQPHHLLYGHQHSQTKKHLLTGYPHSQPNYISFLQSSLSTADRKKNPHECFRQYSIWPKWLTQTCDMCWTVYMKNKFWTTDRVDSCSLMSSDNDIMAVSYHLKQEALSVTGHLAFGQHAYDLVLCCLQRHPRQENIILLLSLQWQLETYCKCRGNLHHFRPKLNNRNIYIMYYNFTDIFHKSVHFFKKMSCDRRFLIMRLQ